MSAATPFPDFSPIRDRFVPRLESRVTTICEQYAALQSQPGYRQVADLTRELDSLAGTAHTLGFAALSATSALAGMVCLSMMRRGKYGDDADFGRLKSLIKDLERLVVQSRCA